MTKYRNIKTTIGDRVFASKREAAHYQKLMLMLKAGLLTHVDCQVRYPIIVNGNMICAYVADFVTYDKDGKREVIDVKGVRTREYIIKKKLMKAVWAIEIKEV